MTPFSSRYLILTLALLAPAVCEADLTSAVQTWANGQAVLQGTSWAAMAAETDGETVFSVQPDLRLAPASTLKLVTSAAVLDALGPKYRFQTPVYADALPDENGVLHGNLYVRGMGDPTLGSARVPGSLSWEKLLKQWSARLRAAGIKRIDGQIYADASLFSGPSVPDKTNWQNMGNYFAAPATALALNDNAFTITFAAQPKHGGAVEVQSFSPQIPGLHIRSFVTADARNPKDNAYVYAAPGQYTLDIYGTVPASRGRGLSIHAALPDAPLLLAQLLTLRLQQDGVPVSGTAQVLESAPDYTDKKVLLTHLSPPLADIVDILNRRSFNFYAEMLLRQLALHAGKPGSVQAGLEEAYAFLQRQGIDTREIVMYDGSGLSRDNQITARALLQLLQAMTKHPHFQTYYRSLATLEDRGDLLLLRRLMKPLKRSQDVHVKGGTLDGVKAQAGYVRSAEGRLMAFVFIANNLILQDESINRFYESLLRLLLEYPAQTQPVNMVK